MSRKIGGAGMPGSADNRSGCRLVVGCLEVDGAGLAALVLLDVVGDALVLLQRAHSGPLHGRDMDERVVSAAIRLNEAIALGFVEKFYGADWHIISPSNEARRSRAFSAKSSE